MDTMDHPAQARREIHRLTRAFFDAVSFDEGQPSRYAELLDLFIEQGLLVNNSGSPPDLMSVAGFVRSRQASVEARTMTRFRVTELSDTTEVFGGVAHRASAFVRRGVKEGRAFEMRGMIFLQFVRMPQGWKLSAAAWDDQRLGQSLAGHAEPTEFG